MEAGSVTRGGISRAVTLDAATLAWTMEVFWWTCSWIPVQQHKLLILPLPLPPPLLHYVKSESKDTILLCKNAHILTSARKGYFQFTLLNHLANFYINHFKENTIHFYSLFYHVKASCALKMQTEVLLSVLYPVRSPWDTCAGTHLKLSE